MSTMTAIVTIDGHEIYVEQLHGKFSCCPFGKI